MRTATIKSDTLIKRSVTKRDPQSLVSKLNFAARVVFGGRTFLRRIFDVMNTLSRRHHHIRVNKQLTDDLSWCASFLSVLNGKTFFVDSAPVSYEEFSTDACPIACERRPISGWRNNTRFLTGRLLTSTAQKQVDFQKPVRPKIQKQIARLPLDGD